VISQVYEVALKMKLPIKFEVLKEDGLPHMKTYITKCTVGTYNATGEGNGKKVIFLFLNLFYLPQLTKYSYKCLLKHKYY